MQPSVHSSYRIFAAWVCLLAALCMYAPLGLAAWPAKASCCASGVCAVPEHHHGGTSSVAEHAGQCEHGAAGMANCNMACCHDQQCPATNPVAYLLPAPVAVDASGMAVDLVSSTRATAAFQFIEPLSPPPRS
jgi:hypothetical protein